jgi:subtilase family serine protease
VGYYLSNDNSFSLNDTYLGDDYVQSLTANNTSNESEPIAIPSSTTPGNYYILYYADYQNSIAESNENNNVASVQITVTPPLPDLIVENQSVSPSTIVAGNTINVSCTVRNRGIGAASSSRVGYYLSNDNNYSNNDIYLGDETVTSLGSNSTNNISDVINIPGNTASGSYFILYRADRHNNISESNENNNVVARSITINAAQPDLIVDNTSLNPTTVLAGSTINVGCRVRNVSVVAAGSSRLGFYLSSDRNYSNNDTYLGDQGVSSLTSSGTSTVSDIITIPSGIAPGAYFLLYYADRQNVVTENDENNNVASKPITISSSLPDLIVENESVNATTIVAGHTITVNCNIRNRGTGTANASSVGFYLSTDTRYSSGDVLLGNENVSSLGVNNSSNNISSILTIPNSTSFGNYYILFHADNQNIITEDNEINNVNSVGVITVVICNPATNLTASNITASSTTINWNTPSSGNPPLGYIIDYRTAGSTNWTSINNVTSNSDMLTGLNCRTNYEFRIGSRCNSSFTSWSSTQAFTTANCPGFTITGSVRTSTGTMLGNTPVNFTGTNGNPNFSTNTNSNGNYTIQVPASWTGNATPSKAGYTFNLRTHSPVNSNLSGQNFVGNQTTGTTYTISGSVRGATNLVLSGVTLNFTNSNGTISATTSTNGNYTVQVPAGWSGTATASKPGYTFNTRTHTNISSNLTGQNFIDITGVPLVHQGSSTLFTSKPVVQCYPNPNQGSFSIDLGKSYKKVNISIYDLSQKMIDYQDFDTKEQIQLTIDRGAGVYFVRINTEEGFLETLKVVITQ